MRKINDLEYQLVIANGAGVVSFMGGCSSKNGQECVLAGNEIFLFEKDEVDNDDWERFMKIQKKEAEEYLAVLK